MKHFLIINGTDYKVVQAENERPKGGTYEVHEITPSKYLESILEIARFKGEVNSVAMYLNGAKGSGEVNPYMNWNSLIEVVKKIQESFNGKNTGEVNELLIGSHHIFPVWSNGHDALAISLNLEGVFNDAVEIIKSL